MLFSPFPQSNSKLVKECDYIFWGKKKYFAFMNKILTLLSLLSRMELNSETEAKKLEQITSKQITE